MATINPLTIEEQGRVFANTTLRSLKSSDFVFKVRPVYKSMTDRTVVGVWCHAPSLLRKSDTTKRLIARYPTCNIDASTPDTSIKIIFA